MTDVLGKICVKILGAYEIVDILIGLLSGTFVNFLFSSYADSRVLWWNIALLIVLIIISVFVRRLGRIKSNHNEVVFKDLFFLIRKRQPKKYEEWLYPVICIVFSIVLIMGSTQLCCSLKDEKVAINEEVKYYQSVESANDTIIINQLEKISSTIETYYLDMQFSTDRINERINELEHGIKENSVTLDED